MRSKTKLVIISVVFALFINVLVVPTISKAVKVETQKVTLSQYHPAYNYSIEGGLKEYYYELYPNENHQDYKKFMKYTYKISDDSVIGLKLNGHQKTGGAYLPDKDGNYRSLKPYNVEVYALGPGTSTLKVYEGKKLIDDYKFTVDADTMYSPSSYVNNATDKENKLIIKFAKLAADDKYTTTNQRILVALNANIDFGGKLMSETEFESFYDEENDHYTDTIYRTAYSRLINKVATAEGYAIVNKAVLNNLGFRCIVNTPSGSAAYNTVDTYENNKEYEEELRNRQLYPELYEDSDDEDYVDELYEGELVGRDFTATTEMTLEYDFSLEDDESIYKKTHLPAWIIGEDTAQQVINVGQTKSLSSCDLNSNIFSSDASVVKVQDGKIIGVNPGVAIVYRYNDTYCDMFFVLVKKKASTKTIKAKIYTKTSKSYFESSDYAPFIIGGQKDTSRIENWENLRIFELEPALGHGGSINTKYSKGLIKCYMTVDGVSELFCTMGTQE